jgi:hypothetical protein
VRGAGQYSIFNIRGQDASPCLAELGLSGPGQGVWEPFKPQHTHVKGSGSLQFSGRYYYGSSWRTRAGWDNTRTPTLPLCLVVGTRGTRYGRLWGSRHSTLTPPRPGIDSTGRRWRTHSQVLTQGLRWRLWRVCVFGDRRRCPWRTCSCVSFFSTTFFFCLSTSVFWTCFLLRLASSVVSSFCLLWLTNTTLGGKNKRHSRFRSTRKGVGKGWKGLGKVLGKCWKGLEKGLEKKNVAEQCRTPRNEKTNRKSLTTNENPKNANYRDKANEKSNGETEWRLTWHHPYLSPPSTINMPSNVSSSQGAQ